MSDPIHNRCYCSNQLEIKQNTSRRGWRCECCFKSYSKDISCYQCTNIEHCEFQERRGNIYTVCQSCYNSKYIDSDETNNGNHCLMEKKIKSAINIIKTEFESSVDQHSEESVRKYMNDVYRYFYTYWLLSIKESPFGSTNEYEMVLNEFNLLYNDILNAIKTKTDLVELELDKNVFVSIDDLTSSSNTKINKISLQFHIITENDKEDIKTQEFVEYHCDENTKCDECLQCKKIKFIMDQYQIYFINKYSTNEMNDEKEEQQDELEFIDVFMMGLNGYSIVDLINDYNHIKSSHVHFHASDTKYFTDCTDYDIDSCISAAVRTFRDISHRNSDINEHKNALETYLQALDSRQRNIIQTTSKIHSFFNHSKQISNINDNIEDKEVVNNLKKMRSMNNLKKRRKDEETLKFNKFIIEIVQHQPTEQTIHSMHMDQLFPILHKQKSKHIEAIDLWKFIEFEQYDSDAIINDIDDDTDIKNEYPHSNLYNESKKNAYLMKLIKTNFNLKNNDDENIPKFIYGRYRFYHWSFMKTYTGYIPKPKYKSLKDECLNNIIWPTPISMFTNRLDKAYTYINTQYAKNLLAMNCGAQNNKYAIPPNYPITMAHIFVLLMYCNDTKLQYNYKKKGCREIVPNEELQSIQERHTEISIWYRLFQETIMFYGTKTKKSDIFYLGLNIRLLFNTYTPHFLCPFSTSVAWRIAHQFSGGVGIVLKLQQDSTSEASTYFNVELLSDFEHERERLFAFTYGLRIMNIQYFHCNTIFSQEIFLRAFNLFSVIFSGYYFNFTMKKKKLIERALMKLIRIYNKNNGITNDIKSTEKNEKSIHVYTQQLFYNLIDKTTHNKMKTSLMIIKSEYLCLSSSLQQYLIRINNNQITLSPFLSAVTSMHNINIINEYIWLIECDEFESLKDLKNGEWLQSKCTYTYNLPSSDNNNELEHDVSKRLNWKIGCNVSIYNDATKTFELGIIESIYTDSNEEFFKIKNTKTNVITVAQRYSKHIKPCDVIKFNMEIRRCSSSNVTCSSFKINILESTSVNNLKFSISIEEIGYFLNGWPAHTLKQGSSKIIRFFRNKLINKASKLTLKIAMFFH